MVNLVGKVPPLEASGAAVTLVHPTATTVVGQWDVTYPQDMPEEQRPNLGPTRTFGYAHRLVSKPPRFARRHVRRDVQIDARDKNGWSNAEAQMDSAARELSGDVVFQRTLTGDDLGALVPNVDFKQGDVLPLMVWGMIVPATCTSIRYTLDDGRRTVEVGFGPSLTADRDGLAESMSQIDRQMRAEAAGIDEYLAKQLDEAKAASDQQMNGLKTYVDEQDTAARTHATSEAGKALTSAKADATTKAGKALSDAKVDATAKANKAREDAETYARNQDTRTLASAKTYADQAAKNQLAEAEKALNNYREQVTGMIGEQGTLTTKLDDLNRDYSEKLGATGTIIKDIAGIKDNHAALSRDFTNKVGTNGTLTKQVRNLSNDLNGLSRDFTNKVGENGTLVKDQRSTLNLIDAMVHGKPHRELTGSEFQAHQQSVNKMQSAFNKKQVDINTGFQGLFDAQAVTNAMQAEFNRKQVSVNTGFRNLFKAQDDINKVNSAFQNKQLDINSGFQKLFEAQAYTNSLQLAFNRKQTGINTVYDAMWEAQEQLDLVQSYLIDRNAVSETSARPQKMYMQWTKKSGWLFLNSTALRNLLSTSSVPSARMTKVTVRIPRLDELKNSLQGVSIVNIWVQNSEGDQEDNNAVVRAQSHGFNFYLSDGQRNLIRSGITGLRIVGAFLPETALPYHNELAQDVVEKYRAKGLKV